MPTLKVKSWDPEQGDHVIIDEENFDPSFMTKFDDEPPAAQKAKQSPEPPAAQKAKQSPEPPPSRGRGKGGS